VTELSQFLRLCDVEHGTLFSCVASINDDCDQPTLFFGAIAVIVVGPARLDSLNGDGKTDGHELQIHLQDGGIVPLLDGHAYEELAWVATLLRKSLSVEAINPPEH
jgi:hypothetical protein